MAFIIDNLTYTYSPGTPFEKEALKDISLKIDDGEFVAIIGKTGSGKSTFIQHLNGLIKATSGAIYYNGEDIYDSKYNLSDLRLSVGMVFQYPEHQLFEDSVFKDVSFGPKNQGLPDKDVTLRAFEALESVGMPKEFYYSSPFELSGGLKRRAAIAGVVAMKPMTLILDEPTAGLDPGGRDEILDMIADVHRKYKNTVILVSHSMEDVAKYADRLIVIDEGRIILDGTPKQVFSQVDDIERIGLSIPQMSHLMRDMADRGFAIDRNATTVEEAKNTILDWYYRSNA